MRILVANPNSTETITDACVTLAREAASQGTEIVGWTNTQGPPVIDSTYADYMAGRPLIQGLLLVRPVPAAIVLAGFGNYGTAAVKEVLEIPVISMAEAALALTLPLCHRFAVITTAPRMIPYTEELILLLGLSNRCAKVQAVGLPPSMEITCDEEAVLIRLTRLVVELRSEFCADLIVLGGSRLSLFAAALRKRVQVPIVEPVACGIQIAEVLVRLRLCQSKIEEFAMPPRPLHEYGK